MPRTTDDHVRPVGHVHDQDDPRLQPVHGESEQLVQADDHAVDGLVAKGAKDFARRWILDKLHRFGVEMTQLPRQVERFASDPDIGADAQGGFRFAHATAQREQKRDACENAQLFARARNRCSFGSHAPSGTKM